MLTNSPLGDDWLGQRIGFLLNGIIGATTFILLDWLLPRWLKEIYTIYNSLHRARSIDRNLTSLSHSNKTRFVGFVIHTICLAASRVWIIPPDRQILYHHGIFGYALQWLIQVVRYLASDGTPDEARISMFAHRDATLSYFSTGYVWIHRGGIWWLFCSAWVWVLLPLTCFSTGMWFLRHHLPGYVRLAPTWLLANAATLFMKSWDLYDIVEAHVVERIPHWIQYRVHRYQQQHRGDIPAYVYSPIQPREMRLLRLKRTSWYLLGPIEAELIHVNMDPPPVYEAVSYRWGSTARTEEILLDGATRTFRITRSAYSLLLTRRSIWRSRVIWIDAICINQLDDGEKGEQVRLMRDIYHHASRVVVFPGGNWTARLAAPLLSETFAATVQFDASLSELNKLTSDERLSIKWKALKELFLDDYFTRVWVVQEIIVGQRVEVYHGGLYISWNIFLQVVLHLAHPLRREMLTLGDPHDGGGSTFDTRSLENIAVMAFLRSDSPIFHHDIDTRTSLDAVLYSTFSFRATDPRDKVFAVLGIATYDDPEGLLSPDYSKSVSDVYRDTAEHLFFHTEKPSMIHLLALAGIGHSPPHSRLSIPSWVPDWNQERLWFPYTDILNQDGSFQASAANQPPEIRRGHLPDSLSLKGIFCDVIQTLGITTVHPIEPTATPSIPRDKHTIVTSITTTLQHHHHHHPDSPLDQRIWLALIAGRIDRKRPSPQHDWEKVFHYWLHILESQTETEHHSMERSPPPHLQRIDKQDLTTYDSALEGCYNRRFAITKQGRLCWVPPYSEVGDKIFIPVGAQTPFLVRRRKNEKDGEEEGWELVGEAYVQGVMWGEVIDGGEGVVEGGIMLV